MQSTLGSFQETQSQDAFALQNSKLLKVSLDQITIQARLGSMVAYQGDVRFEHAGSGGLNKFVKKALTGEGLKLMKVEGSGEVFLAHLAQDIHLIKLEDDQITCNGENVLAFDAGIEWDIKRLEGPGAAAGALAGGLYNMALSGNGWVAIVSDGPPVLLQTGDTPTFCDPQAAITWSSNLQAHLKADVNLKSLIGKSSGESLQIGFAGAGWVLVQPSEGRVQAAASGGSGGGLLSSLGS
ncbi:MAG: AIM24 family protein [Solirubrobacterales bacterium]